MTRIKICGIKTEAHALAAAEAGADFIGFIFTRSARQVTPAQAKKITAVLKESKKVGPEIVGVFVNTPFYVVNRIVEFCCLNRVQLSGDENIEYCREITYPVVKVMRVSQHYQPEQVCRDLAAWSKALVKQEHRFLLDAYDPDRYGGTGRKLDWNVAGEIAKRFGVILAGGLTPQNVGAVIRIAQPWGVDVSSGVETGGEKDVEKIKAFIKAVRDADSTGKRD